MKAGRSMAWAAAFGLAACAGAAGGAGAGAGPGDAAGADTKLSEIAEETSGAADVAAADVAGADEAAGAEVAGSDVAGSDVAGGEDAAADAGEKPSISGLYVDPPLAPPVFSKVIADNNVPVTSADLQGHYTVLWFYPAAGTIG